MKKLLLAVLFFSSTAYAGDLIAIGKHFSPARVDASCSIIYMGSQQDMNQILGHTFGWCAVRVHDTCIFVYRNDDIKGKQASVETCSKLNGEGVSVEGAEKLAATLNRMEIPINTDQAKAMGGEVIKFQAM